MPLFERFNITGYPAICLNSFGQHLYTCDGIHDETVTGTSPYDHLAEALDKVKPVVLIN